MLSRSISEMITEVEGTTNFRPTSKSYRRDLIRRFQRELEAFWGSRRWRFSMGIVEIDAPSQIAPPSDLYVARISNGTRYVTFLVAPPLVRGRTEEDTFAPMLLNDLAGSSFWDGERWREIAYFISDTQFVLSEPWRRDGVTADTLDVTDWKIVQNKVRIPQDVGEVLGVGVYRDLSGFSGTRGVHPVRPGDFLEANADHSSATRPTHYMVRHESKIPAGMKIQYTADQTPASSADDDRSIPGTRYYQFAWGFKRGNAFGPLSAPVKAQIGGTGSEFAQATIQAIANNGGTILHSRWDANSESPEPFEGLQRFLVFNASMDVNTGRIEGPADWRFVTQREDEYSVTNGTDQKDTRPYLLTTMQDTWTVKHLRSLHPGNPRYKGGAVDTWLSFYPRIATPEINEPIYSRTVGGEVHNVPERQVTRIVVRYKKVPPTIINENDSLGVPYDCEELILQKVLAWVYGSKLGNRDARDRAILDAMPSKSLVGKYIHSKPMPIEIESRRNRTVHDNPLEGLRLTQESIDAGARLT